MLLRNGSIPFSFIGGILDYSLIKAVIEYYLRGKIPRSVLIRLWSEWQQLGKEKKHD